jgi:hypothetical protein
MAIIGNLFNDSNSLWIIFIANVFLWLYVFYTQLESYLIYKNDGSFLSATTGNQEVRLPNDDQRLNSSQPVSTHDESIFFDVQVSAVTQNSSKLHQVERPDFFEGKKYSETTLCLLDLIDDSKLVVINPPEFFQENPTPYLDSLIAKINDQNKTLILANLDQKNFGYYKANIETFYDGVDVMTNFHRANFISMEDVISFIEKAKQQYAHVILLAQPNDTWVFKVLQADLNSQASASVEF